MKNAALAILISVVLHVALAALVAGLATFAIHERGDMAGVRLDLSKMEFSIASEEDETQPVAAEALPQTPARKAPPPLATEPVAVEPPPAPNGVAQPENPETPTPEEARAAVEMTPPPTPAPRQARIDAPPHPKSSIKPEYPASARERGEQGEVLLEISVDAAGAVSSVAVVSSSGHRALDDAALKAVRRAKFIPAKSDSRPVAGRVRLTLEFRLKAR